MAVVGYSWNIRSLLMVSNCSEESFKEPGKANENRSISDNANHLKLTMLGVGKACITFLWTHISTHIIEVIFSIDLPISNITAWQYTRLNTLPASTAAAREANHGTIAFDLTCTAGYT